MIYCDRSMIYQQSRPLQQIYTCRSCGYGDHSRTICPMHTDQFKDKCTFSSSELVFWKEKSQHWDLGIQSL